MTRRLGRLGLTRVAGSAIGSVAALLGLAVSAQASEPAPKSSWVELGPKTAVIARAITEAESCPSIVVDGKPRAMSERAAPDPPDDPVRSCELTLPAGAEKAKMAGKKLPLPAPDPKRIAVIGDTGCLLEEGTGFADFQACNDPEQWPFAQVAASVADWDPDLVIHVGDYLYRQDPCPAGNAGCAGSPSGFDWPTWRADFFSPARPALRAAPFLFVRGNHEECSRAGQGWFMWLDPRPMPPECRDVTAPYKTRTAGLNMVVLDSSSAEDSPPLNPEPFVPQFEALPRLAGSEAWLLTHRALWALASYDGVFNQTNQTLQAASGNSLPPSIELVLSGHMHQAEVVPLGPERALQIVAGQGGTQLDPVLPPPAEGTEVAGAPLAAGSRFIWQHGYFTFVHKRGDWSFKIRGIGGKSFADCVLTRVEPCE